MDRVQKSFYWAILATEISHVFCCVLPALFSLISLIAGLGLIAAMPPLFITLHELVHDWEIPVIVISGGVIALGWGLRHISLRMDCHDTGCVHGPCAGKTKSTHRMLWIATGLYTLNLVIFVLFHYAPAL